MVFNRHHAVMYEKIRWYSVDYWYIMETSYLKGVNLLVNVPYDDLEMFMDWTKTKAGLKFNPQPKTFPIIPNCIYWTFMGCHIGSEEG